MMADRDSSRNTPNLGVSWESTNKDKRRKDMKIGWYFNVGRKEFFVESNQQNKTRKFAEKFWKQ